MAGDDGLPCVLAVGRRQKERGSGVCVPTCSNAAADKNAAWDDLMEDITELYGDHVKEITKAPL